MVVRELSTASFLMEFELILLGSLTLVYLVALLYWAFLRDWVRGLNSSSFGQLRKFHSRVSSFGGVNLVGEGKFSFFRSVNVLVVIGSLLTFLLAILGAYWLLSPDITPLLIRVLVSGVLTSQLRNAMCLMGNGSLMKVTFVQCLSMPICGKRV